MGNEGKNCSFCKKQIKLGDYFSQWNNNFFCSLHCLSNFIKKEEYETKIKQ